MDRLRDRFPARQLQPAARLDGYLARRSGAIDTARERRLHRASITGGAMIPPPPVGAALPVSSVPEDAAQAQPGYVYLVRGQIEESDRMVTVIRNPDGSHEYREMLRPPDRWPAAYAGQFGTLGAGDGQFEGGEMWGVAANSVTGAVYVYADSRVQEFTANGSFTAVRLAADTAIRESAQLAFGVTPLFSQQVLIVPHELDDLIQPYEMPDATAYTTISGGAHGGFNEPYGVALDYLAGSTEFICVIDTFNHRLVLTDSANFDRGAFGSLGSGNANLNGPRAAVFDLWSRLWVVDTGNHRVQVFNYNGAAPPTWPYTYAFTVGGPGRGPGQFWVPRAIAVDFHGNVYVSDTENHRVQVFDWNGVFRGMFGKYGSGEGEFRRAGGVAVTDSYVYVADIDNHRVQIFNNPMKGQQVITGELVTTWNAGTLPAGIGAAANFTVMGALPGDLVEVSFTSPSSNMFFTWVTGSVPVANAVQLVAHNRAGSNLTWNLGTVRIRTSR